MLTGIALPTSCVGDCVGPDAAWRRQTRSSFPFQCSATGLVGTGLLPGRQHREWEGEAKRRSQWMARGEVRAILEAMCLMP